MFEIDQPTKCQNRKNEIKKQPKTQKPKKTSVEEIKFDQPIPVRFLGCEFNSFYNWIGYFSKSQHQIEFFSGSGIRLMATN